MRNPRKSKCDSPVIAIPSPEYIGLKVASPTLDRNCRIKPSDLTYLPIAIVCRTVPIVAA